MTRSARRRPHVRLVLSAAILVALIGDFAAQAQATRRRVLVVNDDGAGSSGLAALVAHLAKTVEVIVVAPADDHSFAGRGKTIPSGMLRTHPLRIPGAALAYSIEGTPVDAIQFGLGALGIDHPFDAVVAGINQGSALGSEATSIGVVGAALEAASLGLPAIAVTQDRRAHVFDVSANLVSTILDRWFEKGLPEGIALSINVPGSAADRPRGVVVARLGQPEFSVGGFHKVENADPERQLWRVQFDKVRRPERETDLEWYQRGEITITPLRWDSTAADVLPVLTEWAVKAPARDPAATAP